VHFAARLGVEVLKRAGVPIVVLAGGRVGYGVRPRATYRGYLHSCAWMHRGLQLDTQSWRCSYSDCVRFVLGEEDFPG